MKDHDHYREGIVVKPYTRLTQEQVERLDRMSCSLLEDPGIWCYNRRAADLFHAHGADVEEHAEQQGCVWRIRLPSVLIKKAVATAPSRFVLGARNPDNRLLLDAQVPRVYFGSGSETNVWIETHL
jgi:trimethylamine---corrinoid protein Co-methyltransferase